MYIPENYISNISKLNPQSKNPKKIQLFTLYGNFEWIIAFENLKIPSASAAFAFVLVCWFSYPAGRLQVWLYPTGVAPINATPCGNINKRLFLTTLLSRARDTLQPASLPASQPAPFSCRCALARRLSGIWSGGSSSWEWELGVPWGPSVWACLLSPISDLARPSPWPLGGFLRRRLGRCRQRWGWQIKKFGTARKPAGGIRITMSVTAAMTPSSPAPCPAPAPAPSPATPKSCLRPKPRPEPRLAHFWSLS